MSEGDLVVSVGGEKISGWDAVDVTLFAEAFPNSFSIGASASAPIGTTIVEGAECEISLGDHRIITGYIDRVISGGADAVHSVQIVGRGRTQDLVDCSAEWPTGQLIEGNALTIATKLAEPYGITVKLGEGASAGETVPAWLLNYGESAAEIIQRLARNAGLLAYEDADGVLVLGTAGAVIAASGVTYGENVQAWSVESSMDGRFSQYVCCGMGVDGLLELPGDTFFHIENDPNVPRHRRRDLVLESVATDPEAFTIKRAQWEAARRAGRSSIGHATVDSWFDKDGKPWAPNSLVPFEVPANKVGALPCLSQVTFRRDGQTGTTAELILLPKQAFTPEPITLQPINTADLTLPSA